MSGSKWRYALSDLDIGAEEEKAVVDVIRSRWLSMGPETRKLEEEFAGYMEVDQAMAVANCTCALHLALLAIGIRAGDEVIVPALSFAATANAVLYCGATPVFADITSVLSPVIDPIEIEKRITPKSKAIIVMHYAGYPCDMGSIIKIAKKHNLRVIEDAAHCAGSRYQNKRLGTLGDIGCYSFFANKNLPAGEGGMLVTADPGLFEKLKLLRSHGMTSLSWERFKGHSFGYDIVELGYNYRMPELSAAIARAQLKKLPKHNEGRDRVFSRYVNRLGSVPSVSIPFERATPPGSRHLMTILLSPGIDRVALMNSLSSNGIQTSIHYAPIYSFSYYRENFPPASLEKTEDYSKRVVTLPFHPGLANTDVDAIVSEITAALGSTTIHREENVHESVA